jgi:hypothetical protein
MSEQQKQDRLGDKWIQCPRCENAVYTQNPVIASCPYCSVDREQGKDKEKEKEKEKEKPMSTRRTVFTMGWRLFGQ